MTPFRKGDKVEMTEEGIKNGLDGRSLRRTGTVLSDERDGLVWIHRTGDAPMSRDKYAVKFWRLAQ